MKTNYSIRYSNHPQDFRSYDTNRIREEFLVSGLFEPDQVNLVYSFNDRMIVGGAMPFRETLLLETISPLKSNFFNERRETGLVNVGGKGRIKVDDKEYDLEFKEALYIGSGKKKIELTSNDPENPAKFYINSVPAHKTYPDKLVNLGHAEKASLGSSETSNARTINKLLVHQVLETCQLQMGMTELKTGSVWNTMPPHVHNRRMEAYFYFNLPENQAVCHFMGEPGETRHIWLKNEEAVISPPWSIHAAAGTSAYTFIWGMAGENLDYSDMDAVNINDIR